MSVLAVIPARLGATRLPRKPLRLLGGEPLVVRVHERVIALGIADRVVVATDHQDILTVCADRGIPAVLTREDHPSGTDRVAEVAARDEFDSYAIILNVQGDEPFVSAEALAGAVEIVSSGRAPIGTAAVPIPAVSLSRPDVVKVVSGEDGRALYFSRAPIPYLRDPAEAALQQSLARQHVGVYAYTRAALRAWVAWAPHPLELIERLEQLRPMAHGLAIGVAVVSSAEGGIDTEEDLERANARFADLMLNSLS
jgi:3-deoxy-manno-octulosonate cytidylyltransferase (CMP-KDO synthetase)